MLSMGQWRGHEETAGSKPWTQGQLEMANSVWKIRLVWKVLQVHGNLWNENIKSQYFSILTIIKMNLQLPILQGLSLGVILIPVHCRWRTPNCLFLNISSWTAQKLDSLCDALRCRLHSHSHCTKTSNVSTCLSARSQRDHSESWCRLGREVHEHRPGLEVTCPLANPGGLVCCQGSLCKAENPLS